MKLKVFTFRFSESNNGIDDTVMQEFIADKEVIEFTEHFFIHEKTPYMTILISYRDIAQDEKKRYNQRLDPRKELDEKEKVIYDALRTWRAARAKQEGIPPYMIVNNKQLAKIIRLKAKSNSDLAKVDGIGEAKTKQYGQEILNTIKQHITDATDNSASIEKVSD